MPALYSKTASLVILRHFDDRHEFAVRWRHNFVVKSIYKCSLSFFFFFSKCVYLLCNIPGRSSGHCETLFLLLQLSATLPGPAFFFPTFHRHHHFLCYYHCCTLLGLSYLLERVVLLYGLSLIIKQSCNIGWGPS